MRPRPEEHRRRGRLDHGFAVRPEARHLPRPPGEYLRCFYYDTITHDPTLLRELVAWVGAGHVLLGSDYPFDMGPADPVGGMRAASSHRQDRPSAD